MKNDNTNVSKRIGSIIKTKRKRKNISQTELGEYLGLSHATISRYESGKIPITIDSMEQIATYCDFRPMDYMNAFYSEDDVRLSLRRIISCKKTTQKNQFIPGEDKLLKDIPEELKPVIISGSNLMDYIIKDESAELVQNIIIETVTKNNESLKRRLLKYVEYFNTQK